MGKPFMKLNLFCLTIKIYIYIKALKNALINQKSFLFCIILSSLTHTLTNTFINSFNFYHPQLSSKFIKSQIAVLMEIVLHLL